MPVCYVWIPMFQLRTTLAHTLALRPDDAAARPLALRLAPVRVALDATSSLRCQFLQHILVFENTAWTQYPHQERL
eukprot:5551794-Pleurochrysis_carterae.AAC.1